MLGNLLYRISKLMYSTSVLHGIHRILRKIGIFYVLRDFISKRQSMEMFKHPTNQMLASRRFYDDNADRVKNVISHLADEKSRETLLKMIRFRCTADIRFFPKNKNYDQYFEHSFFQYSDSELLVDCGAFNGDTAEDFADTMRRNGIIRYSIVAFEPDSKNNDILHKRLQRLVYSGRGGGYSIQNSAVYSSNTVLSFNNEHTASSSLTKSKDDDDYLRVSAVRIDDIKECENATFIKMDIEGAELDALKGAENLITTRHPRLAICLYHSDEDMLRIAEWLYNVAPRYKLYVRQTVNFSMGETVLFATL